jgi:hypothetical protein
MNNQQQPLGGFQAFPMPLPMDGRGQEVYEQLFTLAQTVGEAYAEAVQRIGGAYMESCQKMASGGGGLENMFPGGLDGMFGAGGMEGMFANPQQVDWGAAMLSPDSVNDQMSAVQDRSLAFGDNLKEMGRKITVAFVDAGEQAALSAAECLEQVGAATDVELVKTTTSSRADLARKVTRACAATMREIVA